VNFRNFVYTRASFLRLTGYVRNLPGGSVEVAAEGKRAELEQFLGYLHDGPRSARVESVDAQWGEATGAYRDFWVSG
jgi:acylphosphatase